MSARSLSISLHAERRAMERLEIKSPNEASRVLRGLWATGKAWGGQHGQDSARIATFDGDGNQYVICATSSASGKLVIKTILTLDQAKNNLQCGRLFRRYRSRKQRQRYTA